MCALSREAPELSLVSLRGFHDLRRDIERLGRPREERAADFAILDRVVATGFETEILQIVAAATLLSHEVSHVTDLATSCNRSVSAIEKLLHQRNIMSPKALLKWMFCLHAVWHIGVLKWSVRRTAVAAGMRKGDALSARVTRHLGWPLTRLAREEGFDELLTEFTATLRGVSEEGAGRSRRLALSAQL